MVLDPRPDCTAEDEGDGVLCAALELGEEVLTSCRMLARRARWKLEHSRRRSSAVLGESSMVELR